MREPFRVLSLGAGVQSSALALMVHSGELPPIQCAIFADTCAEPPSVYRYLDWLEKTVSPSFPVVRVMHKQGLTRDIEDGVSGLSARCSTPPFYTVGGGMVRRQCTHDFKTAPVRREIQKRREGRPVEQWLGISADEAKRAKPADVKYLANRFPLIERSMSRRDCLRWVVERGYNIPPRSACVYCPYRRNDEWMFMRENEPEAWAEAVRMDRLIRTGIPGFRDTPFVHRSLVPLDEAILTDEDAGQGTMFMLRCDGPCLD